VKQLSRQSAFKQGLLGNLLNPQAGAIFASLLPQCMHTGDPPSRVLLMMLAYEAILLVWLNLYGYLVSRAGQGHSGARMRSSLQRITGLVLIALGLQLAWEHQ
jgi:threonine/homoserine/homoserine lactone efflux protein